MRRWTTVTEALHSVDDVAATKGNPRLSDELAPALEHAEIVDLLHGAGVAPHDDIVEWFAFHNGGYISTTRWQLLSLQAAVQARSDLRVYLEGASEADAWLPYMIDSSETYLIDSSTGVVLHFDLVEGLCQLAPSLPRWIRVATQRSQGITPPLGGERIEKIRLPTPGPQRPSAQRVVPRSADRAARATIEAAALYWSAPSSAAIRAIASPGRTDVVVALNRNGMGELVSVDPTRSPPAQGLVRVREPIWWSSGLSVSPTSPSALINARWVFDFESGVGDVVDGLAGFRSGGVGIVWSAGGRHALLDSKSDRRAVVDCATRQARFVDDDARLYGNSLVWFSQNDESILAQIESLDGRTRREVPAAAVGLRQTSKFPVVTVATDTDLAVVETGTGERGVLLLDLAAGTGRLVTDEDLRPFMVEPSGATILATRDDFPTIENYRITTATGQVETVGNAQPESAPNGSVSPDWRFFAHHVVLPTGRVGVELVTFDTGATSTIELKGGRGVDLMVPIHLSNDTLFYDDGNERGEVALHRASIANGRIENVVELGSHHRGAPLLTSDAALIVWRAEYGVQWCAVDGSGPLHHQRLEGRFSWMVDRADRLLTYDDRRVGIVELSNAR